MAIPTEYLVQLQLLARIALAMALGAAIGFERELRDKPAGLRTHMLLAGAAAAFVIMGSLATERFALALGEELVRADPTRVVLAVMVGVSFLGSGTIFRRSQEQTIEGLTTAASLLITSVIGICSALSQWVLAVGMVFVALATLWVIRLIERRLP
jgi:putative Mg2+ transporter-C (MgtC) family protein